jgi:CubicO group peptidase (beta-lactamase class C family)
MESNYVLPRSHPEAQGISSTKIVDFLDEVQGQNLELHSFMVLRHCHVVAEGWWSPYAANLPHMLFSLSKSFTSTAIGLATAEGLLSLEDRVVSFFPDDAPDEVSPNLSAMQIRHLLMMGTGHAQDTMDRLRRHEGGNWVEAFLHTPVEHVPGTHFTYNSGATYMLSAIVQKVTEQTLLNYLQPRLLEPLGIAGATWESCPRGIHAGGWGLSITTEDIAKFGQLYLQKGVWNGSRLLPEAWVDEATSKHISNGNARESDWARGYGYQFWRCRHGAYRGDGAFGQFCIVIPEQDAVVAITAGTNDLQGVLNAVWKHLLPAMMPGPISQNEAAASTLAARLRSLALNPPQQQSESTREGAISGKVYRLDENNEQWQSFSIQFEKDEATTAFHNNDREHRVRLGRGSWTEGVSCIHQGIDHRVASSFTWQNPDTLELTLRFVETPFCHTVVCRFEEREIVLEYKPNVSFGPYESSPIRGRT